MKFRKEPFLSFVEEYGTNSKSDDGTRYEWKPDALAPVGPCIINKDHISQAWSCPDDETRTFVVVGGRLTRIKVPIKKLYAQLFAFESTIEADHECGGDEEDCE